MLVNQTKLAEIVGLSEVTISQWRDKGIPIERQGGHGIETIYDTKKVIDWMILRAVSGEQQESARERRDRLEADRIELQLAKEAGMLLPADQVENIWANAILSAKAELKNGMLRLKREIDDRYQIKADIATYLNLADTILVRLAASPPDQDEADHDDGD